MKSTLSPKIAFILCIDRGELESKSRLLIDSLRRFGGFSRTAPVWVVQNSKHVDLDHDTLVFLDKQNVNLIAKRLEVIPRNLRFANKVAAASYVEKEINNPTETLIMLDSDMLCLNPPSELLLEEGQVAACTVGSRGIATEADKELTELWKYSFQIVGLDPDLSWKTKTRNDGKDIWAYFNSAIVASRAVNFFGRWKEFLAKLANNAYFKSMRLPDNRYRELDQIALTLSMISLHHFKIKELPSIYNYSLRAHVKDAISFSKINCIEEAVFLHYGNLFFNLKWMEKICMAESTRQWLLDRVPLISGFDHPPSNMIKNFLSFLIRKKIIK